MALLLGISLAIAGIFTRGAPLFLVGFGLCFLAFLAGNYITGNKENIAVILSTLLVLLPVFVLTAFFPDFPLLVVAAAILSPVIAWVFRHPIATLLVVCMGTHDC